MRFAPEHAVLVDLQALFLRQAAYRDVMRLRPGKAIQGAETLRTTRRSACRPQSSSALALFPAASRLFSSG